MGSNSASRGIPLFHKRKFGLENGGLEGIEAKVPADHLVPITSFHPMIAQEAQLFGELTTAAHRHAPISCAAQVFRREEAEECGLS